MNAKFKPLALLAKYAGYVMGHDWRVARNLPVDA